MTDEPTLVTEADLTRVRELDALPDLRAFLSEDEA